MSQSKTEPFIKRALKDPLLHFILLGGLLFVVVSLWGGKTARQDEIIITPARQQHLADLFALTWQRPPSADELATLIEEYIKEEVYYREALALGLDDNDTIIRRRLRQKLEFMQEDVASLDPPTEADLRAYYNNHRDKYLSEHILSFQQIVLSSKRLPAQDVQTKQALQKLKSGEDPQTLSISSLLPITMNLENTRSIENTFGKDFMAAVSQLMPGTWHGPIYSGFGTHLVNVRLNQKPKPLDFEQAKTRVAADVTQSRRAQAAADYYQSLRNQYQITIEKPE